MKKICLLLPLFMFCSCIPEDFKMDDNIYNNNLETLGFLQNQNKELNDNCKNLETENESLSSEL